MSQDKPGLSNEEFIKKWRSKLPPNTLEIFDAYFILGECLDRLEAIIGQGQEERDAIGEVFRAALPHVSKLSHLFPELSTALDNLEVARAASADRAQDGKGERDEM